MPRLRRTDASRPGITRRRSGTGFTYRDEKGVLVTDPDLKARIRHLGIPPAWTDVWIAPYPNGHVQATGIDSAGRRQYVYHPTWREQKDRVKFDRAMSLAESLPAARGRVTRDLHLPEPVRERALATGFRMLDTGSLRVGSERYAEQHGSHGLSTLLCAHVTVSGDTVALSFPAKSGQAWESSIRDPDLAAVVRGLKRRGPRARLLAWRPEAGDDWRPLHAAEINDYVKEQTGGDFTAKDFRTLHGTVAAAVSLARSGPQQNRTRRRRAVSQAMQAASEVLGNTPTVARASYVDPRLVDAYEHGETIDPRRVAAAESEVRALLYR
jgi:DNA topoisomerase-1